MAAGVSERVELTADVADDQTQPVSGLDPPRRIGRDVRDVTDTLDHVRTNSVYTFA